MSPSWLDRMRVYAASPQCTIVGLPCVAAAGTEARKSKRALLSVLLFSIGWCCPGQATAGMEDHEEFEEQDLAGARPGHTIGQPSIMTGMSRNLLHTNSIASQPNVPVRAAPVCMHGLGEDFWRAVPIASQPHVLVRMAAPQCPLHRVDVQCSCPAMA